MYVPSEQAHHKEFSLKMHMNISAYILPMPSVEAGKHSLFTRTNATGNIPRWRGARGSQNFMYLIALLVVTYIFMNNISFSHTIFILMILIIKYTSSDNYSAFLYLCFLGFFPNSVFLMFTLSGQKLYILIFGLQNINTKRCFLSGFLFSLEEKFPISCSVDRKVVDVIHAWWLQYDCCSYKPVVNPPFYSCA